MAPFSLWCLFGSMGQLRIYRGLIQATTKLKLEQIKETQLNSHGCDIELPGSLCDPQFTNQLNISSLLLKNFRLQSSFSPSNTISAHLTIRHKTCTWPVAISTKVEQTDQVDCKGGGWEGEISPEKSAAHIKAAIR